MSEILKQIRSDLKIAMTGEVQLRKSKIASGSVFDTAIAHKTVSRAIISMFPEIGKKPIDATDADVIKLLKKYVGQEKERGLYQFGYLKEKDVEGKSPSEIKKLVNTTIQKLGDKLTSQKIFIAQSYLPIQPTEYEVTLWIGENIDLSIYKNKMQAMGPILKQFPGCNGNFIKSILMKM